MTDPGPLIHLGEPMYCVLCRTCNESRPIVSEADYVKQPRLTEEQAKAASEFMDEHVGHDFGTEVLQWDPAAKA